MFVFPAIADLPWACRTLQEVQQFGAKIMRIGGPFFRVSAMILWILLGGLGKLLQRGGLD